MAKTPKSQQPSRRSAKANLQKRKYMRKYMARKENQKENTQRWSERRRRGIAGKGGGDLSHTRKGGMVRESVSKNRARNGKNGRPTKK